MNKDWEHEEKTQHQDFPSTLRYMERIKDLKILLESTKNRLNQLEKDPTKEEDLILQERIILEGTTKEIQRMEKKTFYLELGV